MSNAAFKHVRLAGVTNVVPEKFISIEDELQYFDNNPKKLERAKRMVGYGKRHVVEDGVTVIDLCEAAANNLIKEMNIERHEIDALITVSQSPDYLLPSSSSLLHGRLDLSKNCASFDVSLGCSGYVYGLWLAHSLIASGASKKLLLLAGDAPSVHSDARNRLCNPLFGDAASATLLEATEEENTAYFSMGSDGKGWDKIVVPAGARKLPVKQDIADLEAVDAAGNVWHLWDTIIHGMDVFNFTMDVAPENINEVIAFSDMAKDDIDFFAIHQANKQIVENVVAKAGIDPAKSSAETFSKYGNNSTNSVVTVIGDQLKDKPVHFMLISVFGVGLSWGSCILNAEGMHNGGIQMFRTPAGIPSREEQIEYWIKKFKGEQI